MENYIYIIKIIAYFMIYSFFGWVMESILKTVVLKKPVNSGFLYGPFCPIYGCGAIIMFLFLQSFKSNIFLLFLMGFVILSIWEYIVGWLLEKIFNTKYWDYSESRCNIKGRVCLLNSLFWGVLGVVFIIFIHPFITSKLNLLPQNILVFTTLILFIVVIIDTIISIVKAKKISIDLQKLKDITSTIKLKLEELNSKEINKETIEEVLKDLRYRQLKIKRQLLRRTNRLKKAFPTMKSETIEKINDFLKEKKENIRKSK